MEAKFSQNQRVEFKDSESYHRVGYVKKIERRGLLRKRWVYNLCDSVKDGNGRKVYVVPEEDIFGPVEWKNDRKERPARVAEHKTFKDFRELEELK